MDDGSASMSAVDIPASERPVERSQDDSYLAAINDFGPALQRLARAYEANAELQRDLLQEIHLAIWRSFAVFDGRCAVRTWVYRVAHNVAASHVDRQRRFRKGLCGLDQIEDVPSADNTERAHDEHSALARLFALIHTLKPLDREVISLFLEDLDARSIADITGLSAGAVATKIHRIKTLLANRFTQREPT
jgi:RNA polymerase sigma factor (sigma-70 family)